MIPARPSMPPLLVPVTLTKLLFVEGDTPMHFCEALLRHLGIDRAVEIRNYGGIRDLANILQTLERTAEFRRLVVSVGVIRDAEDKLAMHARQSVTAALVASGLTPQRAPLVRTSMYVLPDDNNPGMLETLCLDAVRTEPTLAVQYQCVQDFFGCLQSGNVQLPDVLIRAKNQAQAFLAAGKDVQIFPGVAAYRGAWPWQSAAFDGLKQFLQAL